MTSVIEERMKLLGINLPEVNPAAANYLPYIKAGNLIFIAGQTCKLPSQTTAEIDIIFEIEE